eukprot:m.152675 g.152675  ORF g.152675 m.152675 type:complete len:82 (+) comp15055_c0_seq19:166-411(+)
MTDSDRVLRTTEVLDNGQVFQGRVKCVENCGEVVNVRHGRGRLTLPNGSVLRGTWTNGDLRGYVEQQLKVNGVMMALKASA